MSYEVFINDEIYRSNDPRLDVIATENTRRFWRHKRRGGPPWVKFGTGPRGRICYLGQDLNAYIAERRVAGE